MPFSEEHDAMSEGDWLEEDHPGAMIWIEYMHLGRERGWISRIPLNIAQEDRRAGEA